MFEPCVTSGKSGFQQTPTEVATTCDPHMRVVSVRNGTQYTTPAVDRKFNDPEKEGYLETFNTETDDLSGALDDEVTELEDDDIEEMVEQNKSKNPEDDDTDNISSFLETESIKQSVERAPSAKNVETKPMRDRDITNISNEQSAGSKGRKPQSVKTSDDSGIVCSPIISIPFYERTVLYETTLHEETETVTVEAAKGDDFSQNGSHVESDLEIQLGQKVDKSFDRVIFKELSAKVQPKPESQDEESLAEDEDEYSEFADDDVVDISKDTAVSFKNSVGSKMIKE
ncbi:hypothetical protein P879_02634 [Paragonimus westermani]|uniref:Uncharacterized protein n=1 Tax=Paragonimus westermani TaxID=34504 RepID=A0A8T0DSJ7_9TREM|nr:hypothetical protein P879_02634 [Paragonimus westermani]